MSILIKNKNSLGFAERGVDGGGWEILMVLLVRNMFN